MQFFGRLLLQHDHHSAEHCQRLGRGTAKRQFDFVGGVVLFQVENIYFTSAPFSSLAVQ
ncbi:hypothetical protein P3P43_004252 [Escherichia coli]|nr:hypothetical protein [Escherichia coli]